MGIANDNWPATVGIFTGVFAKEVVVGTLNALYENLDGGAPRRNAAFRLRGTMQARGRKRTGESRRARERMRPIRSASISATSATPRRRPQQQNVAMTTIDQMQRLFATSLAAFAYLVFILLYMPCAATIGAIYKELGGFWATFSTTWSVVTAYCFAVIVFQIGSFAAAPGERRVDDRRWRLLGLAVSFAALIKWGRRRVDRSRLIPLVNIT